MNWTLKGLLSAEVINAFDAYFANHLSRAPQEEAVKIALALLRKAKGQGHSALNLADLGSLLTSEQKAQFSPIEGEKIKQCLSQSGLLSGPHNVAPLVLEGNLLYLQKVYSYQKRLVENLISRTPKPQPPLSDSQKQLFLQWFNDPRSRGQKEACELALSLPLICLTGGPGTGKTTTAFKMLCLLQQGALAQGQAPLKMAWIAPTGKAAFRLTQSIQAQALKLEDRSELKGLFAQKAQTIHRFLGFDPQHPTRFRHNPSAQVDCDLVLVDEASMIDLALFCKLVEAIPQATRLILMGDPNQLASVETGAVLKDLVRYSPKNPPYPKAPADNPEPLLSRLSPNHAHLEVSFRFGDQQGLVNLATAVLNGESDLKSLFVAPNLASHPAITPAELEPLLYKQLGRLYQALWAAPDVKQALEQLGKQAVLCAVKKGPFGVEQVNEIASTWQSKPEGNQCWPLMITRNQPRLGLVNGDLGLVWKNHEVWFQGAGEAVSFPLALLPRGDYELAYGYTVHKSQGSEFEEVILLLPPVWQEGLTRELIYTALTRSKNRFTLLGPLEIFQQCAKHPVVRPSGLAKALCGSIRKKTLALPGQVP